MSLVHTGHMEAGDRQEVAIKHPESVMDSVTMAIYRSSCNVGGIPQSRIHGLKRSSRSSCKWTATRQSVVFSQTCSGESNVCREPSFFSSA